MRKFRIKKFRMLFSMSMFVCSAPCIMAGGMSPDELANLEQLTMDLLGKMSPEEQEAVLREAEAMDKYINSLPPEERMRLEQELENELKGVMDSGLLQDLSATPETKPYVQPKAEKPKEPVKEKLAPKEQLAEIQNIAKKVALGIGELISKSESNARASQDSRLEAAWLEKKPELSELQSYALVVANNDKVATALLSDEFKLLKNQIEQFKDDLKNEVDSIGQINQANKLNQAKNRSELESILVQLDLDSAIKFVIRQLDSEQILWNTKRLIQKHAPEEIKKTETPAKQVIDLAPSRVQLVEQSREVPKFAAQPAYHPRSGYPMPSYGGGSSLSTRPKEPTSDLTSKDAKSGGKSGGAGGVGGSGGSGRAGGADKTDKSSKGDKKSKDRAEKTEDSGEKRQFTRKINYQDDLKKLKADLEKDIKKIKSEVKDGKIKNQIEDYALKLAASDIPGATEQLSSISQAIDKLDDLTLAPTRTAQKIDRIISKQPKEMQKKERKELLQPFKSKRFPELTGSIERLTKDPRISALLAAEAEGSPLFVRSAETTIKANNLAKNMTELKKTLKGSDK